MITIYSDPVQLSRHLPERVAHIRFSVRQHDGEDSKEMQRFSFPGLNVRFSVQKAFGTRNNPRFLGGNTGEFGICNLPAEVRAAIANRFREVEFASGKYVRAEVFAGFHIPQMDGKPTVKKVSKIFDGSVLCTSVTAPPDIWFNFSGITNYGTFLTPVEKTLRARIDKSPDQPLYFSDILYAVAEYCGLRSLWAVEDEEKNKPFSTYTVSGTHSEAIQQLALAAPDGVGIFFDEKNGQLIAADKKNYNEKITENYFSTWYINEKSGLIGVPQFGVPVTKVNVLFNPDIYPGDIVHLKTASMPYWNGKYRVARLHHQGELRGNAFYTTLELWNTDENMPFK